MSAAHFDKCTAHASPVRWRHWHRDQGDARAQYNLGSMYVRGEGVPEDYAEAARWYAKAADGGNVNAQSQLGHMYTIGRGYLRIMPKQ
jgi:uncharacterized protein